jgi:hypothetical protein
VSANLMANPELYCGERGHRQVTARPLVIPRGDRPELLEPVDQPLHRVASAIHHAVEAGRSPTSAPFPRSGGPLILPFGNDVADLAAPQQRTAAGIAVAFVQAQDSGSLPGSPPPSWHADRIQDRLQFTTVMALAFRDVQRQRSPAPVAHEVQLAGEPAPAASQPFAGCRSKRPVPLFPRRSGARERVARPPRADAPARWCYRGRRPPTPPAGPVPGGPATAAGLASRGPARSSDGSGNARRSTCRSVRAGRATEPRCGLATECRSPRPDGAAAGARASLARAAGGAPDEPILGRKDLHVPSWNLSTQRASLFADAP